ncbi:small, acid-soluble spore protein K [Thalassobacillus pellis]|uniref:small, acid-soluble spore protein K n=1 Tax=Thalassobacillus pellis TaxID=748008 RepID=UPI003084429F|nr:small acid-soluble spore protein K (minor) [Thalassobacillus pellis]
MRNKTVGFPEKKLNGEPRAKAEFSSKRANGTINTRPQQRMARSSHRLDKGQGEF